MIAIGLWLLGLILCAIVVGVVLQIVLYVAEFILAVVQV